MTRPAVIVPVVGTLLSSCTTTLSFAPPAVPIAYQGAQGSQTCDQKNTSSVTTVNRDMQGAWAVIDVYSAAYSCSFAAVANGRQAFDLPAFVSTTAAATAVGLGATPVATIGLIGTASSSTFNAGKAYYAPEAKADMYASAISALRCIRRVSVGEPATQLKKASTTNLLAYEFGADPRSAQISFSAEEQYFMIVTTAVFQVGDILASRLKGAGKPLASTVADEIKKAADDAQAKQAQADQAVAKAAQNPPPTASQIAILRAQDRTSLRQLWIDQARQQADVVSLQLDALQPALDNCVATAKL